MKAVHSGTGTDLVLVLFIHLSQKKKKKKFLLGMCAVSVTFIFTPAQSTLGAVPGSVSAV